jgi:DNA-binding MarR family transcriptional regulator
MSMPPPRPPKPAAPDAAGALSRVALLTSRWVERLLAPLTVAQYLALHAVRRGDLVAGELARATGVSAAAVSQLLAGLEDAGLVSRARESDDRRRQALALSSEGRRALRAAERRVQAPLAALLAELPPREAAALGHALPLLEALLAGTPPPRRPPPPPPPHRRG